MGKKNEQGIKKAAQDLPLPKDNDLTPNNTTLSDVDNSFAAVDGKFDAVDDQITKNINALRQRTADRNAAASEKTKLAILDKVTIPSSKPMLDPEYNKKTNVVNAVQDSNDTYDDSLLKDMGKDAVSQLVRERIRTAISAFNKRLSQRRAEKIREYNGQFIPAVVMDENALEQAMYKIAKDSENAAEFITQMRNSDVREVNIVMRFLKTGSGKNSEVHILTAYYYLYKSNANFLPLITEILEDANMKMVTDKVLVNAAKSQQIMKRLESQSKASSHEAVQNYAVTMEYIRTTPISEIDPQAFLQVLQYFGDSVVDYNRILEYGYLNVRGRPYGIATLITDMAMQAVKGKYIYAKSNRHGGRGTIVKFDVDKHGIYHTSGTIRDVYGCRPRVDDINRQPLNGKKYEGPYLPINKHYQGMVEAILETNSQLTNTQL